MDLISPKKIRDEYKKTLSKESKYNDVLASLSERKDNEPIYHPIDINYESLPDYDKEQRELLEISLDINSINNGLFEIKNEADKIIKNIEEKSLLFLKQIEKEKERINDINMICGQNSQYNMVIPLYASDFIKDSNDFEVINDKFFGAELDQTETVPYAIIDISGNGLSGNRFIYNKEKNIFQNETPETNYDHKEYILDDNDITKYEYSRYITNDKSEAIDNIINYDDKEVEITITLATESGKPFNKLTWATENKDIIIKNLETSIDGIRFTKQLKNEINNSDKNIIYNDSTYIYGSNIICFPYSNAIRITFSSNHIENDVIAIKNSEDDVKIKPNSRRKKIALNSIKLYNSKYNKALLQSQEILDSGSIDKVALFVSEYIPDHFKEKEYIEYSLIINGNETKIVPVNSDREGIKMIKFSEEKSDVKGIVETIKETIKSIKVKIMINDENKKESPYIGNLKLCMTKNTGAVHV